MLPAQAEGRPSSRQVQGPGTEWQTFQNGYTALILKKKKKKKIPWNHTISVRSAVGIWLTLEENDLLLVYLCSSVSKLFNLAISNNPKPLKPHLKNLLTSNHYLLFFQLTDSSLLTPETSWTYWDPSLPEITILSPSNHPSHTLTLYLQFGFYGSAV